MPDSLPEGVQFVVDALDDATRDSSIQSNPPPSSTLNPYKDNYQDWCSPGATVTSISDHAPSFESNSHSNDEPTPAPNMGPMRETQPTSQCGPLQSEDAVSFMDQSSGDADKCQSSSDVWELEDFDHVPRLSLQTYNTIATHFTKCNVDDGCYDPFTTMSLPPLDLMNSFTQVYFEDFQLIFSLLHQPIFDASQGHWAMVLAVTPPAAVSPVLWNRRDSLICCRSFCAELCTCVCVSHARFRVAANSLSTNRLRGNVTRLPRFGWCKR